MAFRVGAAVRGLAGADDMNFRPHRPSQQIAASAPFNNTPPHGVPGRVQFTRQADEPLRKLD
jgi:hypothetical protein